MVVNRAGPTSADLAADVASRGLAFAPRRTRLGPACSAKRCPCWSSVEPWSRPTQIPGRP